MVSVKLFLAAAAAIVVGNTAVYAADMLAPPPQIVYQPAPCCEISGWYLRGDIGVGVQTYSQFNFTQTNSAFDWPSTWQIVQTNIQDTTIFGGGVGYVVNNWFRVDVTGEYRTKALFKATGSYTNNCAVPGTCFDINSGNVASSVFMANAYLDLGTWWCLTPFIGAGVGSTYNMVSGVQDNGINSNGSVGFGYTSNDNSSWSLAWNVQAGLTYNVNNNLKVDFSWRYLNLGSPQTAIVQCQNTMPCPFAFYTLKDMTSQDFRIGFRWMIQPDAGIGVMAARPVFAQQPQYMPAPQPQYMPQEQYAPPPVYAPQPPLSSRG